MRQTTRYLAATSLIEISIAFASACAPAPSDCGTPLSHHSDAGVPSLGEFINLADRRPPAGCGPSIARRAILAQPCASRLPRA